MQKFLFLILCLALFSCSSRPPHPELQLISESDYSDLLEKNTQTQKIYDGFVNILDFKAVLLTTEVMRAQVDQNARIFQWTPEQYSNEKAKIETNLSKNTDIFLSFFVPERKHDDLAKNSTKWRIFLDAGGKRYDGKATKLNGYLAEIVAIYPVHNRWSTPYKITFPVPTSLIENASSVKLTLTGPVTSTSITFK